MSRNLATEETGTYTIRVYYQAHISAGSTTLERKPIYLELTQGRRDDVDHVVPARRKYIVRA